jgi:hypothetical protein
MYFVAKNSFYGMAFGLFNLKVDIIGISHFSILGILGNLGTLGIS